MTFQFRRPRLNHDDGEWYMMMGDKTDVVAPTRERERENKCVVVFVLYIKSIATAEVWQGKIVPTLLYGVWAIDLKAPHTRVVANK